MFIFYIEFHIQKKFQFFSSNKKYSDEKKQYHKNTNNLNLIRAQKNLISYQ